MLRVGAVVAAVLAVIFAVLSILCFTTGGPLMAGVQIAGAAVVCGICSYYIAESV